MKKIGNLTTTYGVLHIVLEFFFIVAHIIKLYFFLTKYLLYIIVLVF